MAKNYLTYRDDIYVPAFNVEGNEDLKIPLLNTAIELAEGEDPATTILMTKDRITEYVNNEITTAATYVGDISFIDLFELNSIITDFNNGLDIVLVDGRTYGRASASGQVAKEGDTLTCIPLTTAFSIETVFVDTSLTMIQTTNNNVTNNQIQFLQNDVNALQLTKLDSADRTTFISLDGVNEFVPGYTPTTNQSAVTKIYTDSYNATQDQRATAIEGRVTVIEDVISGGVDLDIAESKLTWNGTITGTGTANETTFVLPVSANGLSVGTAFDYSQNQTLEIGLTDSVATSTVYITVGQAPEENWYFKDENIGVTGRIDPVNPGNLIVTQVSGGGNITNLLMLSKVNQVKTLAATAFAKQDDLVSKQDTIDQALQTSTKSVVGAINELKLIADGAAEEASRIANYDTVFSVNYGDEESSVGIIQRDMYLRMLPFITDGTLTVGSAVAVSFRNSENGNQEHCATAEIIGIQPNGGGSIPGTVTVGLDLWVTGEEDYRKGMLIITEDIPFLPSVDEATAIYIDSYAFNGDLVVKDMTDIVTYQELYQAHGTRFQAGDYIKMNAGVDETYTAETIVVHVGTKYTPAGNPPGADEFAIEGKLFAENGIDSKEVYLIIPSTAANIGITIDAWDTITSGLGKFLWNSTSWGADASDTDRTVQTGSGNGFNYVISEVADTNSPAYTLTNITGRRIKARLLPQGIRVLSTSGNATTMTYRIQKNVTGTSTANTIAGGRISTFQGQGTISIVSPEVILDAGDTIRIFISNGTSHPASFADNSFDNIMFVEYEYVD